MLCLPVPGTGGAQEEVLWVEPAAGPGSWVSLRRELVPFPPHPRASLLHLFISSFTCSFCDLLITCQGQAGFTPVKETAQSLPLSDTKRK